MNQRKQDFRKSRGKKYDNRNPNEKKLDSNAFDTKRDGKAKNFKKASSTDNDYNKKKKYLSVPKDGNTGYESKVKRSDFKNDKLFNGFSSRKPKDNLKEGNSIKSRDSRQKDDGVRLNKYIANAGICSRRDADVLIQSGSVAVNGIVVTEMGSKVYPGDKVSYDGNLLNNEKKVYVLLNKPKDFITTSDDPQKRRTVLSLISGVCKERIYPVGRLDRMTTGVLLFTNDGDLTKKLTHPKHGVKKIYHVVLDKNLTKADIMKIIEGVELDDGVVDVDKVSYAGDASDKKEIGVELHSGKNRIVRRLFESLGYNIIKLDRVSFAGLTKKNLKKGQWRFLTTKEVSFLNMLK